MLSRNYLHIVSRIILYCMLGLILSLQIEAIKTTQKIELHMSNFEDAVAINYYLDKLTEKDLCKLRDAHNTVVLKLKQHLKDHEEQHATGSAP